MMHIRRLAAFALLLTRRGWTFGTVSELMGWDWTDVPPPLGVVD